MDHRTYRDLRSDPQQWAKSLQVPLEVVQLYQQCDVVDLHVDSFLWQRLLGRSLARRQGRGPFGGHFLGQADLPRLVQGGVTGAVWVITTNPFRVESERTSALWRNLETLRETFLQQPSQAQLVVDRATYLSARTAGKHAAFLGIQGGNALDGALNEFHRLPRELLLVTLVHMTASSIGDPINWWPTAKGVGLGPKGRALIEALNAQRIFVDLAHIDRKGFFQALDAHARTVPPMLSHAGANSVHRNFRNVDDDQLRAIAQRGGTVGVIYNSYYLDGRVFDGALSSIVDHLQHFIRVCGEDVPALGSDWDGCICTPQDMRTCLELPRLVHAMLQRGFREELIRKVLGGNVLRALAALRG